MTAITITKQDGTPLTGADLKTGDYVVFDRNTGVVASIWHAEPTEAEIKAIKKGRTPKDTARVTTT